jgi:hypothetical protein
MTKYDINLLLKSFNILPYKYILDYSINHKLIHSQNMNKYTKYKLLKRIFILHNNKCKVIQKNFRYKSKNKVLYKKKLKHCINTESLYGDDLNKINVCFIYYYGQFAFDIRELKLIIDSTCINPYTKEIIPYLESIKINKKFNDLLSCNINLSIDNDIPDNSKYTTKFALLLTNFSDMHVYPNVTVFSGYSNIQLLYYIKYIRSYRLIQQVFPLSIYNKIRSLYNDKEYIEFKYTVIDILHTILKKNDDNRFNRALILTECIISNVIEIYNDIISDYNYNIQSVNNYSNISVPNHQDIIINDVDILLNNSNTSINNPDTLTNNVDPFIRINNILNANTIIINDINTSIINNI